MSEFNSFKEAGYQAHNDGASLDHCPYAQGSDEANAWTEGWHDAEAGGPEPVPHTDQPQTANVPQPVTDEGTYTNKPTLDPRMTHVGFTQEQEETMMEAGTMAKPEVPEEAKPVDAVRPGEYSKEKPAPPEQAAQPAQEHQAA